MGFIYKQIDPLFEELGETPDSDALTYISANNITRLQQKAGICRLVKFLKDQSLWTNLGGVFLLGKNVGASSGTSLPDLKGGTSATLTGGIFQDNGIILTGANTDKISVGNRTFTSNLPPSAIFLVTPIGPASTATNSIVAGFSCLSNASTLRAIFFGKDTTGAAGNVIFRADRGTDTIVGNIFGMTAQNAISLSFCNSASDQKMYSKEYSTDNAYSVTSGNTRTYAANSEWLFHNLLNNGTASTEVGIFHCLLFWDSNVAITRSQFFNIDTILRSFVI